MSVEAQSAGSLSEQTEQIFPKRDERLRAVTLPVVSVTLLEDRAQVCRRGRVSLDAGSNRLLIDNVAPVLQDVSLRAEVEGSGRVIDVHVRRARRVRCADKPEAVREVEQEIESVQRQFEELCEDRKHAEHRYGVVLEMLARGVSEIPEDAAWGLVNQQVWRDGFETLSKRARGLLDGVYDHYHGQLDLIDEFARLSEKRQAFDRRDVDFVAWIELDVVAEEAAEVELAVHYVSPNALWRPLHSARLSDDGKVRWQSLGTIWQNTGEDWLDVELQLSTARGSLGTEPPLLEDDLLTAQRKSERLVVQQREVAVDRAGLGPGDKTVTERPRAIDLPGVDDGGEVRNLRAKGKTSIPSDGRPNLVPLGEFSGEAKRQLIAIPELANQVFVKVSLENTSGAPLLAGPVELIREGGFIGWTKVLFVAASERFELSFGHDDGVRVYRHVKRKSEVNEVNKWKLDETRTNVYLSNLEDTVKRVEVIERLPVSEIEHVRVDLDRRRCDPPPEKDADGFCRFDVTLEPNNHKVVKLTWHMSTAPDVEGL